jgi:hypothetical protein
MNLALVRLKLGNRAGYEEICRDMLMRFANSEVPGSLERSAKSCLWSPQPVGDTEELKRLADMAVEKGKTDPYLFYFLFARGLAAYRAGDLDDAVKWCRDSRANNLRVPSTANSTDGAVTRDGLKLANDSQYPPLNAYSLVVEAMALHQQKNPGEARKAYDDAAAIIGEYFPDAPDELGSMWEGWLIYDILSREASALLSNESE